MLKIPEYVMIGWKRFDIRVWDPELASAKHQYGECDHVKQVISLDMTHSEQQIVETLIHEMLHATYDVGCFKRNDDDNHRFDEERTVSFTSHWLCTMLSQNPAVTTMINQVFGEMNAHPETTLPPQAR